MSSAAASLRTVFKLARFAALSVPSAATLRRIAIMSFRLIEPSASRAWTRAATVVFCGGGVGVGVGEPAFSVTAAVPVTVPLTAVTVQAEPVLGAVSSPAVLIVPLLAFQAIGGSVASGRPNWSKPWAVNCCVVPRTTVQTLGETAMLVNV